MPADFFLKKSLLSIKLQSPKKLRLQCIVFYKYQHACMKQTHFWSKTDFGGSWVA